MSSRIDRFYDDHMKKVLPLLKNDGSQNWLLTHVPLTGINEDGDELEDNSEVSQQNAIVLKGGDKPTRQGWLRVFDRQNINFLKNFRHISRPTSIICNMFVWIPLPRIRFSSSWDQVEFYSTKSEPVMSRTIPCQITVFAYALPIVIHE